VTVLVCHSTGAALFTPLHLQQDTGATTLITINYYKH